MQNLVPIQITLQAANASDIKQLVHDLAGTMSGLPNTAVPAETTVSTVQPATPFQQSAPTVVPTAQPAQQQPQFGQQPQYGQVPTQQPVLAQQPPAVPMGAVPTTTPAYTLDQLGVAAQPVMDAGKGPELVGWLQQHGAGGLTQLNPNLYGEFATFLRSLGGRV
jgi:hypothetical protein